MLALKKDVINPAKMIPMLEVQSGSDLPAKFERISEQTGLSPLSLLQKWMLQEETLIGIMQRSKETKADQTEAIPDVALQKNTDDQRKSAESIPIDPDSPKYRKSLIKRVQKLKREGMTISRIAKTFNEENVQTVSGKGKWYSNSIVSLLHSKR